jgi:hypothetical protein
MPSNRRKARMTACLAFAVLANFALIPSTHAGPISDMIARHRQKQAMKLPPMDKPFSTKPIRDPNLRTASLTDRFKKRFSLKKNTPDGAIPLNPNLGAGFRN